MTTDFNYSNTTTTSTGPFKPKNKNVPLNARYRVETYVDIANIPVPAVGELVFVLSDENNDNQQNIYVIKSLKANALGMADSLVDEVVPLKTFLGTDDIDLSDYVTEEELNNKGYATTAEVDQKIAGIGTSGTVDLSGYALKTEVPTKVSELTNDAGFLTNESDIDATSLNGKAFSEVMTQEEYNTIVTKDSNMIYLVTDENEDVGTGMGLTEEQLQQLQTAYNHSQTTHAPVIAEANVQADWNETDTASDAYIKNKPTSLGGDVILTSPNGTEYKLIVSDDGVLSVEAMSPSVYGEIISSTTSLSIIEGNTGTFDVTLSQAPTKDQTINISVDNTDITLNPTSITFNSSNYNVGQTVSVIVAEDSDYRDENTTITLSNSKVSNLLINVSITDNDEAVIQSISAVYNQGSTAVYPSTNLDSLKNNLTVTATYSDNSNSVISSGYSLSGNLTVGTSIITVTYSGKTTTFNVTVSEESTPGMDSAYSYLKVTVPASATTEQSTLYLSKPVGGTMNSLYINDVSKDVPTGVNQVTTSYTLNEGENIIKIKGNFTCWNSKCNINVIQLQKDLTTCRGMYYGCSDLVFSATIPSTVTNTSAMFQSSSISNSPAIPDGVLDTSSMFKGTLLVTAPTVPNSVQACSSMYESCDRLEGTVNVSSSATNLQKYLNFAGKNGTGIILTGINTDIVTNYQLAFYLSKVITIDQSFADLITKPKPSNVTNAVCFNANNENLSTPITIAEVHSDWKQ